MKKVIRIIVVLIFAALVAAGAIAGGTWLRKSLAAGETVKMGVVDYTKLIKEHRDWKKLESLDEKLALGEQKLYNAPSAMEKIGTEHMSRMRDAQQQAESELKAEIDKLQAGLQRERDAVEAQFAEETKKLQAQLKALQEEAKKKGGQGSSPTQEEVRPYGEQLKAFYRDLVTLRDRQVAAKRLELQKRAKEKMDAEKSRIDAELAAYETQISKENQQEKLNIQLKMQVCKDDQEMLTLKQDLSRLTEEESRLKDKKKAEVAAEVEKLGTTYLSGIDKEVDAYRAKIDADIKAQLTARQGQLGGQIARTGGGPPGNPAVAKEYEAKARALAQVFDSKRREMEGKLSGAQAESRRRLEQKKAELEQHLKAQEKSLINEIMKNRHKMEKAEQARIEKQKKDLENLQAERDKLYDTMLEDVRQEVQVVAKKERIPVVVGMYVVNVDSTDLTDKAVSRMKEVNGN